MSAEGSLAAKTVAVVLAGGKGTRLGALTRSVCKPALPFGAAWRNIDFTLSNCINSGLRRIGIATQHKPAALHRHINAAWNGLATAPGEFLETWPAPTTAPSGRYSGTADAVYRNLASIRRSKPDYVLVLAGDHVYTMDYRPLLDYHARRGADATVACVEIEPHEASQFGVMGVGAQGRIEHFVEKPQRIEEIPHGDRVLASMGIYVFNAGFLDTVLNHDAFTRHSSHDFGADIVPRVLGNSRVYAYRFVDRTTGTAAFWRDVGTPAAYWRANLELLDPGSSLRLDDTCWPLPCAGEAPQLSEAFANAGPQDRPGENRSLIARGCSIAGTVRRSVLFSRVQVARGAHLERSVILPGAVVGRNCRLDGVIVDSDCRVPDGLVIDAARQRTGGQGLQEPVVLTQENLEIGLGYSNAG